MGLLKVIPLGGSGEIGKNCTLLETDDQIIVLDCGLSFVGRAIQVPVSGK